MVPPYYVSHVASHNPSLLITEYHTTPTMAEKEESVESMLADNERVALDSEAEAKFAARTRAWLSIKDPQERMAALLKELETEVEISNEAARVLEEKMKNLGEETKALEERVDEVEGQGMIESKIGKILRYQ